MLLTVIHILLQIIRLKFLRFNVEESNTCAYDNVTVYDGVDNLATRLGRYCGTTLPGYIFSNNNSLFVFFQSDSSVTKNGFKIKYTTFLCKYHFSEKIPFVPVRIIDYVCIIDVAISWNQLELSSVRVAIIAGYYLCIETLHFVRFFCMNVSLHCLIITLVYKIYHTKS